MRQRYFSGFDPYFSFGILAQLSSLKSGKYDDINDAMKLLFERSILKTVAPGNQIEMMLVTQLISVHQAMMNVARLLAHSKTHEEIESYGNIFNKFAHRCGPDRGPSAATFRPCANAAAEFFP